MGPVQITNADIANAKLAWEREEGIGVYGPRHRHLTSLVSGQAQQIAEKFRSDRAKLAD